jgi:broad specificity phosphatase PhoE
MPRLLYLVRHSLPRVEPDVPDVDWLLSSPGTEDSWALGRQARDWGLRALYSSPETRAFTTAVPIARTLGLPIQSLEGLRELRLAGWVGKTDEFHALVREVLSAPHLSAYGCEPARDAAARFQAAVDKIAAGPFPAAAVSHGRVLTAYLASVAPLHDPFAFWRSIPLPGWAVLDLDEPAAGLVAPFVGLGDPA